MQQLNSLSLLTHGLSLSGIRHHCTNCSIAFVTPGHQTEEATCNLDLWMPWWPWCIFARVCCCILDGITMQPWYSIKVLLRVRLPWTFQYILSFLLSWFLFDCSAVQNSINYEQILSFACAFAQASKWSAFAGSPAVIACTNCSVSVELALGLSVTSFVGAQDNASAVYKDFPGTWWMVYWNRIRWNLNCTTQGGSKSNVFWSKSGMRGLWSVSSWITLFRTYSENLSKAHVSAKASFSIWA